METGRVFDLIDWDLMTAVKFARVSSLLRIQGSPKASVMVLFRVVVQVFQF